MNHEERRAAVRLLWLMEDATRGETRRALAMALRTLDILDVDPLLVAVDKTDVKTMITLTLARVDELHSLADLIAEPVVRKDLGGVQRYEVYTDEARSVLAAVTVDSHHPDWVAS